MYRTGDFGYIKNGLVYYEGRRDTQIKVRGQRLDITEIEKSVNELEYVEKSAILVYHAQQLDQALVAFITVKKSDKTATDVVNDLKNRLTENMIPQVIIIEEFPYLIHGKIDRQSLLKIHEEMIFASQEKVENFVDLRFVPNNKLKLAREVFQIIGESLGSELRNKITADSNFFELGGNSKNIVFTVTQLQSKGFHIGLAEFIDAKNVVEILNKISTSSKEPKVDDFMSHMALVSEPIDNIEKEAVIDLLGMHFLNKHDLDTMMPNMKLEHYKEALQSIWDNLIEQNLSYMVKTDQGEIIGVALNFDCINEPSIKINNPLEITYRFLESIEHPVL